MSKRPSSSENDGPQSKKREQEYLDKYCQQPGITPSRLRKTYASCKYCSKIISIASSGQFDISRHCETKGHLKTVELLKAVTSTPSIVNFMPSKSATPNQLAVVIAETMFSELIVKMNLPLSTADIISKTVKSAFPDSQIAASYGCCHGKTKKIVEHLASTIKVTLREKLRADPPPPPPPSLSLSLDVNVTDDINTFDIASILLMLYKHRICLPHHA